MSYLDMRREYELMNSFLGVLLFLPALIGFFVFPLFVLVAIGSGRLRGKEAVVVVIAEVAIESAQCFAMLPMV